MEYLYHLIIQGPILSKGRNGKTNWNTQLTNDSIVDYNCVDNINKIIQNFDHVFESIVIVTWNTEKIEEHELCASKKVKLVKLEDVTPNLMRGKTQLPTSINNKFKQFYSCAKAFEFMHGKPQDYVIKFRTDQYLDLAEFVSWHKKQVLAGYGNRLFVPYISRDKYNVSDFYFIAPYQKMQEFFEAVIADKFAEFNPNVHIEISLKYAYYQFRKNLRLPRIAYFLNTFYKRPCYESVTMVNFLTTQVYLGINAELQRDLYWRGEKVLWPLEFFSNMATFENWDTLKIQKIPSKRIRIWNFFLYSNIALYMNVVWSLPKKSFLYKILSKGYHK